MSDVLCFCVLTEFHRNLESLTAGFGFTITYYNKTLNGKDRVASTRKSNLA